MAPECVLCHRPIRQRLCFEVEFYRVAVNSPDPNSSGRVAGCVHAYCLKRILLSKHTVFVHDVYGPERGKCQICSESFTVFLNVVQVRIYVSRKQPSEFAGGYTPMNTYHRECLLRALELDNPVETMIMAGYI